MTLSSAAARRLTVAEVCAIVLVAAATFCYRFLTFTQFPNDHFVNVAIGQQMSRGAWPVRDFVERGAPLMSYVSALGQRWIGEGLRSELLIVVTALALAAALCVFLYTRLSGSLVAGSVLALAPTMIYPLSYSYPKLLLYAAALAATWLYLSRPSLRRVLLLGAVLATAFLFRHDHGVFLAAGVASATLALHGTTRHGVAEVCRIAGVALLLSAPYLGWVQIHEGLVTHVRDSAEFSRRESERSAWSSPTFALAPGKPLWSRLQVGPIVNVRWDPKLPDADVRNAETRLGLTRYDPAGPRSWQYELRDWSPSAIQRLVSDPAVADTHGIDRTTFALQVPAPTGLRRFLVHMFGPGEGLQLAANSVGALYYAVWVLPFVALVIVVLGWRQFTPPLRSLVLMTIAVQLAMDATMLRDPLNNRIRDVIVPAGALVAFVAGAAWWPSGIGLVRFSARSASVVLVAGMTIFAAAIGEAVPRASELMADGVSGLGRRARVVDYRLSPPQHRTGGELAPGYQQLVAYIRRCTPERSRLLTLAFAPELYFYTGREFAAGHVMFIQGYYLDDRHNSLMMDRLAHEDVPLVVLDAETRGEIATDHRRLWDHVTEHYREAGRFEIRPGRTFVVMADAARPVLGRFEGTPLPCFRAKI